MAAIDLLKSELYVIHQFTLTENTVEERLSKERVLSISASFSDRNAFIQTVFHFSPLSIFLN